MERDPAYAREIFAKIDAWFTFDAVRNEAMMPGSTWDMAQAVAIGEDGNICNACSSSPGGEITYSKSGSDNKKSWWDLRMARHAEFMKLAEEKQLHRRMQASELAASAAAKARLAEMLSGGKLREIFGSEIAGLPTETVLEITRLQIWGPLSWAGIDPMRLRRLAAFGRAAVPWTGKAGLRETAPFCVENPLHPLLPIQSQSFPE